MPRFVTYYARIEGSDTASVITYLEKWVSARGVLIVMGQLLPAQSYCPVQIRSVNGSQCILPTTEMPSALTTSIIVSMNSDNVIVIMAVVVVIEFLMISMLLVIVGVLLKKGISKGTKAKEIE